MLPDVVCGSWGWGQDPRRKAGVPPASPGVRVQPWRHPLSHPPGLRSESKLPESSEARAVPGVVTRGPAPEGAVPKRAALGLMFCSHHLESLTVFESGTMHFQFALGPTNNAAGPDWRPLQGARCPFCPMSPRGEGLRILVACPETSPLVQALRLCKERPCGGKA